MSSHVDTHTHLDHHGELTPADQVERARAVSVTTLVTVGTDLDTSQQAIDAARTFNGVHAVVGIHPNDAQQATDATLATLAEQASDPTVVGIGETGLDFYRDWCPHDVQERSFRAHIDLARDRDLTLVIHCRDAWTDSLRVLHDHGAPERVVMHCFSGDESVARHCNEQGWFMSFAGNVTFKNAQDLRDAAAVASLDLLLTETDSPYLTPEPHRGARNDSSMIPLVVAQLAEVHGLDVDELAPRLVANAHRAFALPAAELGTLAPDQGTAS
jgi:TatD DNase family protein